MAMHSTQRPEAVSQVWPLGQMGLIALKPATQVRFWQRKPGPQSAPVAQRTQVWVERSHAGALKLVQWLDWVHGTHL